MYVPLERLDDYLLGAVGRLAWSDDGQLGPELGAQVSQDGQTAQRVLGIAVVQGDVVVVVGGLGGDVGAGRPGAAGAGALEKEALSQGTRAVEALNALLNERLLAAAG